MTIINHHRTSALLGRSRSPIMHCIDSSIIGERERANLVVRTARNIYDDRTSSNCACSRMDDPGQNYASLKTKWRIFLKRLRSRDISYVLDLIRSLCVPWRLTKSLPRACIESRMLSTCLARPYILTRER